MLTKILVRREASNESTAMTVGKKVVLISLIVAGLRSADGNFTILEQAELITDVSKFLRCGSVVILSNDSGIPDRSFYLGKYLSDLMMVSAIWDFKKFYRMLYSDEINNLPKTLIVVEYSSRNLKHLIAISKKIDFAGFDWLIFTSIYRNVRQVFKDIVIPINIEFVVSTAKEKNAVVLYELYKISSRGKLFVSRFGLWTPGIGLQQSGGDAFNRRMDLKGHEFKFAVHNLSDGFDPCQSIQIDNGKQMIQCAYFDVWKDLERVLNYRTKYVVIEDCYQNGSMGISTPMLEMIRTGEADSGEDGYIWSSSRLEHNQFLWPLFHSKVILVTKIPSRKFSFSSYLRPFVKSMWIVLIGWLLLSGVAIGVIKHVATRQEFPAKNEYLDSVFIPFTAMCYQGLLLWFNFQPFFEKTNSVLMSCVFNARTIGSTSIPQKAAVRLAYLMIYLIPVLFIPSYSGSVISSLSVPSDNIPFSDLEEFEKDGTYKLAAINNTFFQFFLMTDHQFETIRSKNLMSRTLTMSYEQSFKDICSKKITFIFEWPLLSRYTINCDVFKFDLSLKKIFSSMAVRKNFPYLELFNRQMQKLITSGLNVKILEKNTLNLFKHEVNPFPQRYHQIKPFGFEDVLPLFAVLFGGVCLSAFLLALEKYAKTVLKKTK